MHVQETVVALARQKHRELWTQGSDVSTQTKSAIAVCKSWQQAVSESFPGRFAEECVVGTNCNEKIDLVDNTDFTAYELKVSPNNTHFEFYRDVFKIWVQRELGHEPLKKLVFITPEKGAKRLEKQLGKEVRLLAAKHGLIIELAII
jgi:hypothetical protein